MSVTAADDPGRASGALAGVRVVDLTRFLAGPFCTQLLADMGADVIKVESPGGDPVREYGARNAHGISAYFAQFNRNKRSIVLDLRSAEGREALADLIRGAEVLVENFRAGVLDEMGFDAERLDALNPRLVTASTSGYGPHGPYARRPSFDFIAQAMSGFMSVNGEPDGPPMRTGPPISDLVAGLYTAFGIAGALAARRRGGDDSAPGQRVETDLVSGLVSLLAFFSSDYLETGTLPVRTGNDHPITAPYGLFEASDGYIAVAPASPAIVRRLLETLGLSGLLDDARFADNTQRLRNREAMRALIEERTREGSVEFWIEALNAAGCPCGQVKDLAEVFSDPQVLAREMLIDVPHPGRGNVRMSGFPLKLSATPCRVHRPSPDLGEHTEEVLAEVGYGPERVRALRGAGPC